MYRLPGLSMSGRASAGPDLSLVGDIRETGLLRLRYQTPSARREHWIKIVGLGSVLGYLAVLIAVRLSIG